MANFIMSHRFVIGFVEGLALGFLLGLLCGIYLNEIKFIILYRRKRRIRKKPKKV